MQRLVSENEELIAARLANPNKAEARAWLDKHTDKCRATLGELLNDESLELVNNLYNVGAVEVIAVEIDEYESEGENTGKLVIVLPGDKENRAKVLNICSGIAEELGFDPLTDYGQKRVFLMLD
jgi:hypothetical protein